MASISHSDLHVIDAHTHVFPPEVCSSKERYLAQDSWFGKLYAAPKARLVTAEDLIASMDRAGISRSVMCGWPWKDPGLTHYHNEYLADAASRYPERLWWLAIVSPSQDNDIAESLEFAKNQGARGVGELNADAQGFDLGDRAAFRTLAEICLAYDWPVMIHASEPVGHQYPGKGSATPDKLMRFVQVNPDLKTILAHWGGGLPFYELMPEVGEAARNVWYDSAASTYLYDFRVFQVAIDIVGSDRVLFGSDYPVLRQDRFLKRVAGLEWASADARDNVMTLNAHRLFGSQSDLEQRR